MCFFLEITKVIRRYSLLPLLIVSMWYPFQRISLKLRRFHLNLVEQRASLMWILVPLGKIIVVFSKPWIKSTGLDIVLTLDLTNNKLKKYFLWWKIVCIEAQSTRHAFILNIVWCIKVWERSMYLFVREKIKYFF